MWCVWWIILDTCTQWHITHALGISWPTVSHQCTTNNNTSITTTTARVVTSLYLYTQPCTWAHPPKPHEHTCMPQAQSINNNCKSVCCLSSPLSIYTALYLGTPSQATRTYMHASGTEHQQQLQELLPLSIYIHSPVPGHTLPSHTNIHACLRRTEHQQQLQECVCCLSSPLSIYTALYLGTPSQATHIHAFVA